MKMRSWMILALAVLGVAGSTAAGYWIHASGWLQRAQARDDNTRTLIIKWQRLVDDSGQTCDRCGTTQEEVRKAQVLLAKSLSPLGITVVLEERKLDRATAAKNILESNRIWVAGKPLETWIGATQGMSDCTSCGTLCGPLVQGNVACRTLTVGQNAFESIPSELIVKAGLLAAAEMVGTKSNR